MAQYCYNTKTDQEKAPVGGKCESGWTLMGTLDSAATPGDTTATASSSPEGVWVTRPGGLNYGYDSTGSGVNNPSSSMYSELVPTIKLAEARWLQLPEYQRNMFSLIAMAESGNRGSGKSTYTDFVQLSAAGVANGQNTNPYTLAMQYARDRGIIKPNGQVVVPQNGPGSNGPGPSGPAAPVPADATGMRRVMDSLATNLVGRTLSDEEFNSSYKDYAAKFAANPDVDPTQVATESVQGNPDYQEYQVATKFAKAFDSVLRGAS